MTPVHDQPFSPQQQRRFAGVPCCGSACLFAKRPLARTVTHARCDSGIEFSSDIFPQRYMGAPDPPLAIANLLPLILGHWGCAMPKRHPPLSHTSPTEARQVACTRCRANAHLLWYSPLPAGLKGEMRVFQCRACGKQTKIIVPPP